MNLSLGEKIKMLRNQQYISQADLAYKLGIMPSAISKYETGYTKISSDTLVEIAKILNTTPDFLLGFSDNEKSNTSTYSDEDIELLELIKKLPTNSKYEVKGYIKGILSNQ